MTYEDYDKRIRSLLASLEFAVIEEVHRRLGTFEPNRANPHAIAAALVSSIETHVAETFSDKVMSRIDALYPDTAEEETK